MQNVQQSRDLNVVLQKLRDINSCTDLPFCKNYSCCLDEQGIYFLCSQFTPNSSPPAVLRFTFFQFYYIAYLFLNLNSR